MAKDYAKQTKTKAKGKAKRGKAPKQKQPLAKLWYITAIAVVAFVGGLLYLKHEQVGQQLAGKPSKQRKLAQRKTKPHVRPTPTVRKPRFEFYDMLAQSDSNPAKVYNQEKIKAQEQRARYFLQVAAFKNMSQADRLRADLTLKGFTVAIKQIKSKGNTWSRVQVGPYASLSTAKQAQQQLKRDRYKSVIRTN